jgi:hypothetical protein
MRTGSKRTTHLAIRPPKRDDEALASSSCNRFGSPTNLPNAGSSPQSGIAEHLTDTKGRLLHDFLHACAALLRLARQAEMMSLYKLGKFRIDAPQPFVAYPTGSHHIVIGKGDRVEVHSLIDRLVP